VAKTLTEVVADLFLIFILEAMDEVLQQAIGGEPCIGCGVDEWYAAGKAKFGLIAGYILVAGFGELKGTTYAEYFFGSDERLAAPFAEAGVEHMD
jgi:hypothetical protein